MDEHEVAGYFARLGITTYIPASPPQPDYETLRLLHAAHLYNIPFENLSIHLGEPITLEPTEILEKLVGRRRGGFCFELNGAFSFLLRELGYDVTLLAARVQGEEGLGLPLDHLALVVECERRLLVDVGFGAHSIYPLEIDEKGEQQDPGGVFRVEERSTGAIGVFKDGTPQYRIEPIERELPEFEAMCWYHQTSPSSHFTQGTICTLPTTDGRVTIADDRLIRSSGRGERQETTLGEDELLAAYRNYFGIELDKVPVRKADRARE